MRKPLAAIQIVNEDFDDLWTAEQFSVARELSDAGRVTPNLAERLSNAFGASTDFWLRVQETTDRYEAGIA